jgi:LPXTG-motif cell wall-anchored protein
MNKFFYFVIAFAILITGFVGLPTIAGATIGDMETEYPTLPTTIGDDEVRNSNVSQTAAGTVATPSRSQNNSQATLPTTGEATGTYEIIGGLMLIGIVATVVIKRKQAATNN